MQTENKVALITGASSGLGHAMALEFARKGYDLVLAARRKMALNKVARECEEAGAQAFVCQTDVSDQKAVEDLCAQAIEKFGHIDVWVNNAGVAMYGKFEDAPIDAMRKVIETDLFGAIYGSRAAIKHFRQRGMGRLINVSSMEASAPQPYSSAYVAAKSAVKSLGESLRMELSLDKMTNIHVTTVMPSSTDTPLFQNAANYTGRVAQPMNPVYDATYMARQIVRMAGMPMPRREVVIGPAGKLQALGHKVMPRLYEMTESRFVENDHLKQEPAMVTEGNLHEPSTNIGIDGGWREQRMPANKFNMIAIGMGAALAVMTTGMALLMARKATDKAKDAAEKMADKASGKAGEMAGDAVKTAISPV